MTLENPQILSFTTSECREKGIDQHAQLQAAERLLRMVLKPNAISKPEDELSRRHGSNRPMSFLEIYPDEPDNMGVLRFYGEHGYNQQLGGSVRIHPLSMTDRRRGNVAIAAARRSGEEIRVSLTVAKLSSTGDKQQDGRRIYDILHDALPSENQSLLTQHTQDDPESPWYGSVMLTLPEDNSLGDEISINGLIVVGLIFQPVIQKQRDMGVEKSEDSHYRISFLV